MILLAKNQILSIVLKVFSHLFCESFGCSKAQIVVGREIENIPSFDSEELLRSCLYRQGIPIETLSVC